MPLLPIPGAVQPPAFIVKYVSLAAELAALRRSLEAVAECLTLETLDQPVERDRRLAAVLNLTAERVRLLRRAVVGAVDARELLAQHNESDAPALGDDPDILLVPGSPIPLVPKGSWASPGPHVPKSPRSSKGTRGRRGRG